MSVTHTHSFKRRVLKKNKNKLRMNDRIGLAWTDESRLKKGFPWKKNLEPSETSKGHLPNVSPVYPTIIWLKYDKQYKLYTHTKKNMKDNTLVLMVTKACNNHPYFFFYINKVQRFFYLPKILLQLTNSLKSNNRKYAPIWNIISVKSDPP